MVTDSQIRSSAKYKKKYIRRYVIELNLRTEDELYMWLEDHDNKAGYIKGLIKEDIKAYKKERANLYSRLYGIEGEKNESD